MSKDEMLARLVKISEEVRELAIEISQQSSPSPKKRETVMTTQEVAKMTGLAPKTIARHVKCGNLHARFPMAKKRFHVDDVEKFMRGMKSYGR